MMSLSTLAPRGGGVTLTPPWNDRVIRNQLMAENKWPSSLNQPGAARTETGTHVSKAILNHPYFNGLLYNPFTLW